MIDAPPSDFRILRFSTDRIARPERFEMWREVLTRKLLRVAIDPLDSQPFQARVMMRAQHGFRIGVGTMSATISRRGRSLVNADNDDLALMVNLGGAFILSRPKGDLSLGKGDACLVSCAEMGDVIRGEAGRQLCIRMPRAAIAGYNPDVEAVTGRFIPRDTDTLRLMINYVMTLFEDDDMAMAPGASEIVVRHITDLVGLTIGAGRDEAVATAMGGLKAARLRSIKAVIRSNLQHQTFSVDDVADQVGVSPRYVRALLQENTQMSFSMYLNTVRLKRAYELLTDLHAADLSITTIAFKVGFGDVSYFNRRFRQVYHATPSDVRADALGTSGL